jgi:hypothetical protein
MLAIGVGVLGLAGCAIFSDRVGNFVKSCFSTVKSWFGGTSDQSDNTNDLSSKLDGAIKGLTAIKELTEVERSESREETLAAGDRTFQPVEFVQQQQPQNAANHEFSTGKSSLASDSPLLPSDSDESESPTQAAASSFGY